MYRGHDVDLSGSCDVIGDVTIWLALCDFLLVLHWHGPWTVFEILSLLYIRVATLTFQGHVTSSVTWPFNSPYTISYRCYIGTNTLSPTDFEISNVSRSRPWSFRVTWHHRSRDHLIRRIRFPIRAPLQPTHGWLSPTDFEILRLKCV